MRKNLRKLLAGAVMGIMAFSLVTAAVPASAAKDKKKKTKNVDLNGTYHATLGIQTATDLWITRMGYYEKSQNEFYGTENADKMFCENKETHEMEAQPGTFQDVEIKGNGTYTVSLDNGEFSGERIISQLHVATDIPVNDTIKFSNVSASINGKTVAEFEEGFMENEEPYLQGGMVCLIFNHWRAELVKQVGERGLSEDCSNGYTLLLGSGQENVSITFTVSGFSYDNPEAQGISEDGADTQEDTDVSNANESDKNDEDNGSSSSNLLVILFIIPFIMWIVSIVLLIVLAVKLINKKKKS